MEKSTISALVVAGAGVVGAIFQALVLRAAKRKKMKEGEEKLGEQMREFDSNHGIDGRE